MRGTPAKQLDLEVAYAAADLQDRSARNPTRRNVVDYCPRRRGESSALIALRCTPGEAARKDRLVIVVIAAFRHSDSISVCVAATLCRTDSGSPGDPASLRASTVTRAIAVLDEGSSPGREPSGADDVDAVSVAT